MEKIIYKINILGLINILVIFIKQKWANIKKLKSILNKHYKHNNLY